MGILDVLTRLVHDLGYQGDVPGFVLLFGLALARIVTALSMSPFLGGRSTPSTVKVGLGVVIVALLYPGIAAPAAATPINPMLGVALLVKEVLIGATIGLLSQLVFYAVQMAGVLIDTQRGMDQPAFISAQLSSNTSVLGNFQFQAALVLFLILDGHLLFLKALHASYVQLPLVGFPHFRAGIPALVDAMARVSAGMLVIAVQMSAPVLVALFIVDVCFGAIGKVASRVNVYLESQPVKSMVGLALVFLIVGFLLEGMRNHLAAMIRQIYEFLNIAA
jgi:flagellar biosynthesis protein FliR